jgi:Acetyltransferase (GNAT) domain
MEIPTSVDVKKANPERPNNERPSVDEWVIRPYRTEDAAAWKAFLQDSNNGTLFHDLDFLSYHPPGKYNFHHLVGFRGPHIEAVIPGALSADGVFVSLAGASIGGPAVKKSLPAEGCMHLVEALQFYCNSARWQGIEIILPPPIYNNEPDQIIEFALHVRGFQLVHRSMSLLIPLDQEKPNHYERVFRERQRRYVRAFRRKGVAVTESDIDGLGEFLELLEETHARLKSQPTHTPAEIRRLFDRVPGHLRIWSAHLDGTVIASMLLFILNRNICVTFYLCDRASHRANHGATVLLAEVIDALGERGYRYLDMGPSASTVHFNHGVVGFKESLGARAFCRDRWRWQNCVAA